VLAAREEDLDLSGHASTPLTPEGAAWADRTWDGVIPTTRSAAGMTEEAEVVLLTDYLPEGDPERGEPVPDPVGGGLEEYREVLQLLRSGVEGLLEHAAPP
jgi:protein-tyrosine-phosphatase